MRSKVNEDRCGITVIHESSVKRAAKYITKDDLASDCADFLGIFGDSTRIKIISALSDEELCVCDISYLLGMTQSAVSHQLKLLRSARIVTTRREGKIIYYSLSDHHVKKILLMGIEHVKEKMQ